MSWTAFTIIGVVPEVASALVMIYVAMKLRQRGNNYWRITVAMSVMMFGMAVAAFLFGTHRAGREVLAPCLICLLIAFLVYAISDPSWRRRQQQSRD